MKKCLAFAGAVLVLAPAVFLHTASAFQQPNKKTAGALKKPVDFTAQLNGTTNALGPTGVTVKIQSAAIAKDGTITVRATIVDSTGIPLDRLGIATNGPVSLSYVAAYIPAGQTQYVAYTTSVDASATNNNPSQTQAANDSGGTFVTNAIGDYTYTFKTKAPTTFDATATTSIGVSAYRNLSAYGTFDEWSESSNDVFNFVPNGSPVTVTRAVVTTADCNQCHDPMNAHGGNRLQVQLCILCHQPQSINPDTKNTVDMKVFIHKIHMGSSLPSVVAGTPYEVYHRGAWVNFSTIVFPQDIRNCTTCHGSDAAQGANYKTKPGAAACGSCHDNVNFATGVNHAGGPQLDDRQCAGCHPSVQYTDFDASVPGAHLIPTNSTALPGIVAQIQSVTNGTPGNAPTVKFSLKNNAGNPLDITKLTYIRIILVGANVDYGVTPPGMARASENPAATATGSNGVYTYTMTNKVPTTAAGSFTVSIEAYNTVTLLPGTSLATTTTDAAIPTEFYFSVDKSAVVARRTVVSLAKCESCHRSMGINAGAGIHGFYRSNTQECVLCHNPTLVDGTSGQSVNFAWQIHSIHRGSDLANPYTLGSTNYQSLLFPGDLRDCTACHNTGTYLVEKVGAKASVASKGGFTPTTPPISAACQGCHDDIGTASHALANTTVLGESCTACHSAGEEFSVDRVHQRIF